MVSFNIVDTVVSFIKTNQSVQISSKYPAVIKNGQSPYADTRTGGSPTAHADLYWTVYPARITTIRSNYTVGLMQGFMNIDLRCLSVAGYTGANLLAAVQDVELQFRENFISSAKVEDYELEINIDDVRLFADGTLRYTKWVDTGS